MQNLSEVAIENQAVHPAEDSGEIQPRRKVGVVIVRSAELGSPFFHGPRPGRNFPIWNDNEDWARRVAEADCFDVRISKGRPESERRGTWGAHRPGLEDA